MRHATCRDTTIHHLIARGNNRQSIFPSPPDQEDFLARLGQVIARYEWTCLAYCLMGNHFHLVVDSDVWHVPNGMRDLMSGFARAANRRAERTGHLFQERHKAIPIRNDAHLFSTIAYVLNNPVRARIIESPEKWPWSNCAALLGLAPEAPFMKSADTLRLFHADRNSGQDELRQLVMPGPAAMDVRITALRSSPEAGVPSSGHSRLRRELGEIFALSTLDDGIRQALNDGYPQSAIAHFLGVTPSAVSQRLRRRGARG